MVNKNNPMSGEGDKTILSRIAFTILFLVLFYLVCRIPKWRVIFEDLKRKFSLEEQNRLKEDLKEAKLRIRVFINQISDLKVEKDDEKNNHQDQLNTIRNEILKLIDRCKGQNVSINLQNNNGEMQLCHDENDVNSMDFKSQCLQHINELDKIIFVQQQRTRESTERVQQRLDEALEKCSEHLETIDDKDKEISEKNHKLNNKSEEIVNLNTELSEASAMIEQLKSSIDDKEKEISEKDQSLIEQARKIDDLEKNNNDLTIQLETQVQSYKDMEQRIINKSTTLERIIVTIRSVIERDYAPTGNMNDQLDSIDLVTDQNQLESLNSATEKTKNLKELLMECVSIGKQNVAMSKNISNELKSLVNREGRRNEIVDSKYRKNHRYTLHDNSRRIFGMTMINIEVRSVPADDENQVTSEASEE